MSLQIYDDPKVLKHVRSDNGFALWRPNDNVAGNGFASEIKQTEAVGKLRDATIGQLQRDGTGRFDA
jgi:hypothetical protein